MDHIEDFTQEIRKELLDAVNGSTNLLDISSASNLVSMIQDGLPEDRVLKKYGFYDPIQQIILEHKKRGFIIQKLFTDEDLDSYKTGYYLSAYRGRSPEIEVTDAISRIGSNAFADNTFIEVLDLMSSKVTRIFEGAFRNCQNLRKVVLPPSLLAIYSGAFAGCHQLKTITIPANVDYLDDGVFAGCVSLQHIRIPAQLKKRIHPNTFAGCSPNLKIEWYDPETNTDTSQIAIRNFRQFLEKKQIDYEMGGDGAIQTYFRGKNAPNIHITTIFWGDGTSVTLEVASIATVPQAKQLRMAGLLLTFNESWRWVKFSMDREGLIRVRVDSLIESSNAGAQCYRLMRVLFNAVDDTYSSIKKYLME